MTIQVINPRQPGKQYIAKVLNQYMQWKKFQFTKISKAVSTLKKD